mgnify:CR=1 FL=1
MSLEVNIEKKLNGFTLRSEFTAGNTATAGIPKRAEFTKGETIAVNNPTFQPYL